jgi:hypothetical protein
MDCVTVALQAMYTPVFLAKLLNASSAWWDLRLHPINNESMVSCVESKQSGLYPPGIATFKELWESANDKLFLKIMADKCNILYSHLPPIALASQNYNRCC